MKLTTESDRRRAVMFARSFSKYDWESVNPDDVDLLCSTLLDVASVFQVHAPVLSAVRRLVTPDGQCAKEWAGPWRDLITAVQAWREYEAGL